MIAALFIGIVIGAVTVFSGWRREAARYGAQVAALCDTVRRLEALGRSDADRALRFEIMAIPGALNRPKPGLAQRLGRVGR